MALRHGRLIARPMDAADADSCAGLWISQYRKTASRDGGGAVPDLWLQEPSRVRQFISSRAETGYTLIAGNDIVGYLVSDRFDFHGRSAAFCPVLAHSVAPEHGEWGYRLLYRAASADWVTDGILDHYITLLADDDPGLSLFFDLGFGRYVIDAYRLLDRWEISPTGQCDVRAAGREDIPGILHLMEAALEFFRDAPLFLVQSITTEDEIAGLLDDESGEVFLATVGDALAGIMNVRIPREADPITLVDPRTARLDPIGAYIRPEYRNRGIGDALLDACVEWCKGQAVDRVHVDYEGANLYAAAYWIKHFHPDACFAKT